MVLPFQGMKWLATSNRFGDFLARFIAGNARNFLLCSGLHSCSHSHNRHLSAFLLLDDSDCSCESNSESESSSAFRGNIIYDVKCIQLFTSVVRVVKSLNWDVARKMRFAAGAVERYGFDNWLMAMKMFVHVYACTKMEKEMFALLRDMVDYYCRAGLSLFGVMCTFLDSPSDSQGSSTFIVDVLIKVLASNGICKEAVDVFVEARRVGLQPGIRSCNFLLKCLKEANEREFVVDLFEVMKRDGPLPSVYTYTIMMNFYCGGHDGEGTIDLDKATDILREMDMNDICPSALTYSTYILGMCRVGFVELAWEFIQTSRDDFQQLNCYCYNAVIQGFVNRGELDRAMQVFKEMKNYGIAADVYSYSILIEGFCAFGNVDVVLRLFQEMGISGIKPSLVTYSSVLKGLCGIGESMDASLHWFRNIIGNSGYAYDQHVYNILIDGFCVLGQMDSAIAFLEEMRSKGLAPSSVTYKSLILGFCKVGSFEESFKFFDEAIEAGALRICNDMVHGYCNEGHIGKAWQIMDKMRDSGIYPSIFAYSAVINRMCKEEQSEKSLRLIPVMLKCNTLPSVVIYSILIDGFAKQGNPMKACMLYTKMLKVGICPDVVTYTVLINMFSNTGRVTEAYRLFNQMISDGINPDTIAYTSMVDGFCQGNEMRKAWELFQEMGHKDILPSVVTYTCLIDGFCKISDMEKAKMLVRKMHMENICPDLVTCSVLVRGYLKLGWDSHARMLFNQMKNSELVPHETTLEIFLRGTEIDKKSEDASARSSICK